MNEKEVIERLNRYKTIKVLYGNIFAIHLEQLEQLQNDIETVLNLLEKKEAIINEMAKDIKSADELLDSMGYMGEYAKFTIEEIIEEYERIEKF